MTALRTFWDFTRPHTIIGSAISVSAIAWMSLGMYFLDSTFFLLSLLSALACNVFITGYNQVVDVALDRRNKPNLPLASGAMGMRQGKIIVLISLLVALTSAALASTFLLILVAGIAALGFAYSWKETFLKRRHTTAALAITVVRGLLVNVGFYLHFSGERSLGDVPDAIWLLTAFITLFSLGIAWFKDIPDMRGDAEEGIGTLALQSGALKVFRLGTYTVASGYLIGAFAPLFFTFEGSNSAVLTVSHALLGILFLSISAKTDPLDHTQIKRFYKLFWVLFFLEYVAFVAATVLVAS